MSMSEPTKRILGIGQHYDAKNRDRIMLGFIIEVEHEPEVNPWAVLTVLEQGMSGKRPPNSWLSRRKRRGAVEATVEGKYTYRGRTCCFESLSGIEAMLASRHDFPVRHTCPGCQTVYSIRHGVLR
jgi:hypothetical protein